MNTSNHNPLPLPALPVMAGSGDLAILDNEELLRLTSGDNVFSQYRAATVELEPMQSNFSDISSDEEPENGLYLEKDQLYELEHHSSSSEEECGMPISSDEEAEYHDEDAAQHSGPSNISFLSPNADISALAPRFELLEMLQWEDNIYWGDSRDDKSGQQQRSSLVRQRSYSFDQGRGHFGQLKPDEDEQAQASAEAARRAAAAAAAAEAEAALAAGCPLNRRLAAGDWLADVVWDAAEARRAGPGPVPLVLDATDTGIPFGAKPTPRPVLKNMNTLTNTSVKDTAPVSRRKQKRKGMDGILKVLGGGAGPGGEGGGGGGGGADGAAETHPRARAGARTATGLGGLPLLDHSHLALQHTLVRADWPRSELRQLHRPRRLLGPGQGQAAFRVVLPPRARAREAGAVTFRGGQTVNQMRREKDIAAAEGAFVLLEYAEEAPPLVGNPGMATRLVRYRRAQEGAGGGGGGAGGGGGGGRDGAGGRRGGGGGGGGAGEEAEGGAVGLEVPLGPADPSPFLGEVAPGAAQLAVANHMFQAPAFPHAPRPTDYLLARRPRPRAKLRGHGLYQVDDPDQNISEMVIRKIPRIYVVGQTEPQMEVYDVGQQASKKNFNELEKHFAEYHLGRYFDSKDEGTPVDLHQAMALWRHQPFGPEFLKKRLAAVADCDKTTGLWYRKPEGQFPPLEELAARFRPEDVCAYEACLRGRLRARDAGIARLTNPQKVADALRWLQQRLKAKRARAGKAQRRADAARSGGASRERRARAAALARVAEVLQAQVRELQRVIEVARYIRTELLWSPWYQTQSFVQVHLQGKESGKLRLTGIGDPSGVGEGFSFVREEKVAGKAEKANALKLTGTDELVKQVTGTTADLRKLSMKDSERILLNLGMTPAEVKALKRWDRIYLIRYKCTAAVSAGGATSLDLAKFSRGGRMSHAAEMKLYRERCNDIWARQAAALSSSAAATAEEAAPAGGGGRRAPTPVEDEAGDDGLNSEPEEAEDAEDSSSSMDDMEDEIFGDVEEEKAPQPAQEQARLAQLRQAMADETEAEQEAKEAAAAAARRDALWFLKGEIPKHAVKQVKRVVDPKGVETLTVSFNTDPKLLPKVRLATNLLVKKGAKPSALGDFQGPLAARREAAAAAAAETLRGRGGGRGRGRGRGGRGGGRAGPTTLNLTQISRRIKQHKDAQVARKEREERERLEELHPHRKRRGQARARRQSARARLPHAKLNAVLERVLAKLMARRDSLVFHNPVNKREVPAYYTVITNPMDLRKVKTKILEFEYHSAAPFLDDLRLMRDNARTFNGEVSTITKEAVALVRQAEEEVAALRAELEPLEQASAEHYGGGATGSQKRKRKARPPKAAAAGAAAAGPSSGASSGSEGGGGAARPVNLAALRGGGGGGGGGGGRRAEDNNSTGPESGAEEEGNNGDSSKKGGNPFIIY